MKLFKHQEDGVIFLTTHPAALLADEMGTGKTRQVLEAANVLFHEGKISQLLVLCPAAVRYAWSEELGKLVLDGFQVRLVRYRPEEQRVTTGGLGDRLTVLVVSYGLLSYGWGPQGEVGPHVLALEAWARSGKTILCCDESSFLKNAQAAVTKGALRIRGQCRACWLLNGTPVANSPDDLFAQGLVMADGGGPNAGLKNFYHFRNRYGRMGGYKLKQWIPDKEKLDELRRAWQPYVLRREKADCLDLPPKVYEVREIALRPETWRIYQELKRDAIATLSNDERLVEPQAGVRLLRLCQLTSGHVGSAILECPEPNDVEHYNARDISSEKLDWLVESILHGELASEPALIVWCRWRRERERLGRALRLNHFAAVVEVHGSQTPTKRDEALAFFQTFNGRRVLLAQPHAGGFGLNLTVAKAAVYLSNDYSYITRVQSEDRCHRAGQVNRVTYVDALATGPGNERTVDHVILKALRAKEDIARWTCARWRKELAG